MAAKCIIACVFMLLVLWLADAALPKGGGTAIAAANMAALTLVGAAAYFAATLAMRTDEAMRAMSFARRFIKAARQRNKP
jgi:hypothetical protein